MFKRVHLIVLDSVGIGQAPDADKFNDVGADTLGHIAEVAGLTIPHLENLGLGTIAPLKGVKAVDIIPNLVICRMKNMRTIFMTLNTSIFVDKRVRISPRMVSTFND